MSRSKPSGTACVRTRSIVWRKLAHNNNLFPLIAHKKIYHKAMQQHALASNDRRLPACGLMLRMRLGLTRRRRSIEVHFLHTMAANPSLCASANLPDPLQKSGSPNNTRNALLYVTLTSFFPHLSITRQSCPSRAVEMPPTKFSEYKPVAIATVTKPPTTRRYQTQAMSPGRKVLCEVSFTVTTSPTFLF